MKQVLIVDDDAGMRAALDVGFRRRGWRVDTAVGTRDALAKFKGGQHSLVITDIRMPDGDGFAVMRAVRTLAPRTAVILLTAFASVPDAVEAMKGGACDYLVKPISFERLEQAAVQILGKCGRSRETEQLVGRSPSWLRVLDRARHAAATNADVLIEAESGTGKELIARLIHTPARAADRPFVAVNCAAFPETCWKANCSAIPGALSPEQWRQAGQVRIGQRRNTSARRDRRDAAQLQPKLLRALQETRVRPAGQARSSRSTSA